MYCVKCGVRLQDGVSKCPLCQTPVWNPDGVTEQKSYPEEFPSHYSQSDLPGAVILTGLCAVVSIVILVLCLKLYGHLNWGGYGIGGILLFYVIAVLPKWFRHVRGEIFIPAAHAAAALYALYICVHSSGSWYLSFALPVIAISCLLSTGLFCLLKYIRRGRIFIIGGFLILLAGFTVLIEYFLHISFGVSMFRWSLFTLSGLSAAGLFLLLVGIIPPLRKAIDRRFFF